MERREQQVGAGDAPVPDQPRDQRANRLAEREASAAHAGHRARGVLRVLGCDHLRPCRVCVVLREGGEHPEAQTEDERDRAAAHFGDGEKGTEHHVGEATGSNARVQTEAARGVREEEDGWQDAGGHEEQAKADRPCVKAEGLLEGEYHDEDVRVERPSHVEGCPGMASKLRRAQRFGEPLRLLLGTGLLERWRWEQAVVHERKRREAS